MRTLSEMLRIAQDICDAVNKGPSPYMATLPLSSYMWIKYGPARGRWRRSVKWAAAMRKAALA